MGTTVVRVDGVRMAGGCHCDTGGLRPWRRAEDKMVLCNEIDSYRK